MNKIPFVRPPALPGGDELWNGGPPPDGDFWCFLTDFIRDLGRLMSLTDAMEKHSIDPVQWEFLVSRSPWFVNAVNQVLEIKRMDAMLVARQRAIGHKVKDDNGEVVVDADGVPIRRGFDAGMARFFLEVDEKARLAHSQSGDADADFPLLSREEYRQAQVADCRRALLSLQPQVDAGDRQAIDTMVKVQDRLAKLLGTDQPRLVATFHTEGVVGLSDEELMAIAAGKTLTLGSDGVYEAENGD